MRLVRSISVGHPYPDVQRDYINMERVNVLLTSYALTKQRSQYSSHNIMFRCRKCKAVIGYNYEYAGYYKFHCHGTIIIFYFWYIL